MSKLKVVKKDERGYTLEKGIIIADTFAETCSHLVI